MKITKVLKHGNPRWRVNEPYGPDGKRPAVAALPWRALMLLRPLPTTLLRRMAGSPRR